VVNLFQITGCLTTFLQYFDECFDVVTGRFVFSKCIPIGLTRVEMNNSYFLTYLGILIFMFRYLVIGKTRKTIFHETTPEE
jgi:hypothetical protein